MRDAIADYRRAETDATPPHVPEHWRSGEAFEIFLLVHAHDGCWRTPPLHN